MKELVPIFICGIMPIAIVLIQAFSKMNNENKRSEILIKAIEANNNIDADKIAESLRKPQKSAREILNLRLLRGCIFTLVGIGLFVAGFLSWANGVDFGSDSVFVPVMFGCCSVAVGVSYLIVYFVTRKDKDDARQ